MNIREALKKNCVINFHDDWGGTDGVMKGLLEEFGHQWKPFKVPLRVKEPPTLDSETLKKLGKIPQVTVSKNAKKTEEAEEKEKRSEKIPKVEKKKDNATTKAEKERDTVTTEVEKERDTVTSKVEKKKDTVTTKSEKEKDTVTTTVEKKRDTVTSKMGKERDTVTPKVEKKRDTVTSKVEKKKDTVTTKPEKEKDTVTTTVEKKRDTVTSKVEKKRITVRTTLAQALELLKKIAIESEGELEFAEIKKSGFPDGYKIKKLPKTVISEQSGKPLSSYPMKQPECVKRVGEEFSGALNRDNTKKVVKGTCGAKKKPAVDVFKKPFKKLVQGTQGVDLLNMITGCMDKTEEEKYRGRQVESGMEMGNVPKASFQKSIANNLTDGRQCKRSLERDKLPMNYEGEVDLDRVEPINGNAKPSHSLLRRPEQFFKKTNKKVQWGEIYYKTIPKIGERKVSKTTYETDQWNGMERKLDENEERGEENARPIKKSVSMEEYRNRMAAKNGNMVENKPHGALEECYSREEESMDCGYASTQNSRTRNKVEKKDEETMETSDIDDITVLEPVEKKRKKENGGWSASIGYRQSTMNEQGRNATMVAVRGDERNREQTNSFQRVQSNEERGRMNRVAPPRREMNDWIPSTTTQHNTPYMVPQRLPFSPYLAPPPPLSRCHPPSRPPVPISKSVSPHSTSSPIYPPSHRAPPLPSLFRTPPPPFSTMPPPSLPSFMAPPPALPVYPVSPPSIPPPCDPSPNPLPPPPSVSPSIPINPFLSAFSHSTSKPSYYPNY